MCCICSPPSLVFTPPLLLRASNVADLFRFRRSSNPFSSCLHSPAHLPAHLAPSLLSPLTSLPNPPAGRRPAPRPRHRPTPESDRERAQVPRSLSPHRRDYRCSYLRFVLLSQCVPFFLFLEGDFDTDRSSAAVAVEDAGVVCSGCKVVGRDIYYWYAFLSLPSVVPLPSAIHSLLLLHSSEEHQRLHWTMEHRQTCSKSLQESLDVTSSSSPFIESTPAANTLDAIAATKATKNRKKKERSGVRRRRVLRVEGREKRTEMWWETRRRSWQRVLRGSRLTSSISRRRAGNFIFHHLGRSLRASYSLRRDQPHSDCRQAFLALSLTSNAERDASLSTTFDIPSLRINPQRGSKEAGMLRDVGECQSRRAKGRGRGRESGRTELVTLF